MARLNQFLAEHDWARLLLSTGELQFRDPPKPWRHRVEGDADASDTTELGQPLQGGCCPSGPRDGQVDRQGGRGAQGPQGNRHQLVRDDRQRRGEPADPAAVDMDRVRQLERENAELRIERDVLSGSVVLWVKEAMR